jgi:hypothetical protein
MATRVEFVYNDKIGDYNLIATVNDNGTVIIHAIETDDGEPCDIQDWTPNEQFAMRNLARKRASELEADDGEAERDSDERDDTFYDRGYSD